MQNSTETKAPSRASDSNALWRWISLSGCTLVFALVWLVALPALSRNPTLQNEIRDREVQGIDSSALFYTDLEMMDEVLERIHDFQRTHPSALWQPSGSPNGDRAK